MLNRRHALTLIVSGLLIPPSVASYGQDQSEDDSLLAPMDSPSITDLTKRHPFGSHPASEQEMKAADAIIAATPTGPRPIDVAQFFYDRYYTNDPHAISEWPKRSRGIR